MYVTHTVLVTSFVHLAMNKRYFGHQTCVQFMNGECIHWMHSPFNELHSWMHSLLKMVNVNVNAFTFFSEWWIDLYNWFSIHFRKHKMDFLMRRERWKLYLFIEDIAFNKINFSKFSSLRLPLRPCNMMDPKLKSLSTEALLIKAALYFKKTFLTTG